MVSRKIVQFGDHLSLAAQAFWQLLHKVGYAILFVSCFGLFLYFLTFFRDGSFKFNLLCSSLPIGEKLAVLGGNFRAILDNFTSLYGWSIVLMCFLQAICICLLVYAWRNREKNSALDGASASGIGAVLGFLALGCPSCGVTFVTPILTAIAGTGAAVLTESVSNIFIVLAILLMIYTIAKLGYLDYVILSAKKYEEKHAKI